MYAALRTRRLARLRELQASARLAGAERARFIDRRVQALVAHAYTHVPHHHRAMRRLGLRPDDIGGVRDLRKLPVLRRTDVSEGGLALRSTDVPPRAFRAAATSGSSGTALRYGVTRRHLDWLHAAELRSYEACGWRPGQRFAIVRRHMTQREPSRWIQATWLRVQRGYFATPQQNGQSHLGRIRTLAALRPRLVSGQTHRIIQVVDAAREASIELFAGAVQTHASTLTRADRARIEEAFHAPVFDRYGSLEAGVIAHECERRDGWHVEDDFNVVEVARGGEPVAPGESGTLLVTNLRNLDHPFLRYEINDEGRLAEEPCPCGRPTPILSHLDGRSNERIPLPGGGYAFGHFNFAFEPESSVRSHQVVMETDRDLLVRLVVGPGFDAAAEERIRKRFQSRDGLLRVRFERVDSISRGPGGKPQPLIRLPGAEGP